MKPTTEMIASRYMICKRCKEGQRILTDPETPNETTQGWMSHHLPHQAVDEVAGAVFLSQYLREGYIDVDHEDLEPLDGNVNNNEPTLSDDVPLGGAVGTTAVKEAEIAQRSRQARDPKRDSILIERAPIVGEIGGEFDDELHFRGSFDSWLGKLNVKVPRRLIDVQSRPNLYCVSASWSEAENKYIVTFDPLLLKKMEPEEITRLAIRSVIQIGAMQRFGSDRNAATQWLYDEMAQLLAGPKKDRLPGDGVLGTVRS